MVHVGTPPEERKGARQHSYKRPMDEKKENRNTAAHRGTFPTRRFAAALGRKTHISAESAYEVEEEDTERSPPTPTHDLQCKYGSGRGQRSRDYQR